MAGGEAGAAGVDGGDGVHGDFGEGDDADETDATHGVLIADLDLGALPASEGEGGGTVLDARVEGRFEEHGFAVP
ncbi:MAG TPA: hypothetical protein QGF05_00740, partial [Dehalococcoidia bacterium]|nr:hypothetical protein [Dehalococcoidia bacterium]